MVPTPCARNRADARGLAAVAGGRELRYMWSMDLSGRGRAFDQIGLAVEHLTAVTCRSGSAADSPTRWLV